MLAVTLDGMENEMANGIRLADELGGICEADGCVAMTTSIVYDRDKNAVLLCCEQHAEEIMDAAGGEYDSICPNCGCEQPIN